MLPKDGQLFELAQAGEEVLGHAPVDGGQVGRQACALRGGLRGLVLARQVLACHAGLMGAPLGLGPQRLRGDLLLAAGDEGRHQAEGDDAHVRKHLAAAEDVADLAADRTLAEVLRPGDAQAAEIGRPPGAGDALRGQREGQRLAVVHRHLRGDHRQPQAGAVGVGGRADPGPVVGDDDVEAVACGTDHDVDRSRLAVGVRVAHHVRARLGDREPHVLDEIGRQLERDREGSDYQDWIDAYDTLTDADRTLIRRHIDTLPNRPLISILMPTYETSEAWLRRAIESVRHQLYPNWELCIADDASEAPHVRRIIEEYRERDPRIKVVYRPQRGHISAASNSALTLAGGVYAARARWDDRSADAVVNIGYRPTFEESQYWIEAYLFDFSGDLYERTLTLDFLSRIRPEMKFPGVDALKAQVQADMGEARRRLRAHADTPPAG